MGLPDTLHASEADLNLLNGWQRGFPLCDEPFAVLAQALGRSSEDVLQTCERLHRTGWLSRIGAVFAPGAGGAGTLAAMAVPASELDAVAALVSAHPGVNHNYERENALNLWFVVTGPSTAAVEHTILAIEHASGLAVLRLPMQRPYRIDLAFDLRTRNTAAGGPTHTAHVPVAASETPLAGLAEQGLPLVARPYDAWAEQLGWSPAQVIETLARWLAQGTLSRFGMVVRHHEAGYTANAMTVFNVPPDIVDACGQALARQPGVTLAYRRARAAHWPYNLYCMVHGQERAQVLDLVGQAIAGSGLSGYPHEVLFSLRRFTQRGPRRFSQEVTHA